MAYLNRLTDICVFVLDLDGVLTDGTVYVSESGEQLRRMNIKDGYAIQLAIKKGYKIIVISGAGSNTVIKRLNGLGITDIHLAAPNKVETFKEYIELYQINPENVLYMGDDIPDFHVMQLVGLPTCPQDSSPEIKAISSYISHRNGGKGAVRDVIEQVMRVQGKWNLYFNGKHD